MIKTPQISDMSAAIKAMPEGQTLLRFEGAVAKPVYAGHIDKFIVLMEWPAWSGANESAIKIVAAVLPHGPIHVAQVFCAKGAKDASTWSEVLGTLGVWTIKYPDGYDEKFDDHIADHVADFIGLKTLGAAPHA